MTNPCNGNYNLPWNVYVLTLDAGDHLAGEVEDGVLVWLDRLSGINNKCEGRVEDLLALSLPGSS